MRCCAKIINDVVNRFNLKEKCNAIFKLAFDKPRELRGVDEVCKGNLAEPKPSYFTSILHAAEFGQAKLHRTSEASQSQVFEFSLGDILVY